MEFYPLYLKGWKNAFNWGHPDVPMADVTTDFLW